MSTGRDTHCACYAALHPIRRDTPDQKGCNAYGSGAPPPTTSPTAGIFSRHTQAAASDAAAQPRNTRPAPNKTRYTRSVALHPTRRATPDPSRYTHQKGCHAYGSGAPPPTTSTTADSSSRHAQAAASDAATQPRNTCPAPNKRRYTRSVAIHPIRRAAPDHKGCNAYRSGVASLSNKPPRGKLHP